MLRKILSYVFIILLLLTTKVFAQNIDSLHYVLSNTEVDSLKINILLEIAENQEENDSALFYAEEALKYSEITENKQKEAEVYVVLSYIYTDLEFSEKVIEYLNKAEKYYLKTNNSNKLSEIYKNIGFSYENDGDYGNAGVYYLKALKIIETLDNKIELARILNNIGSIYYKQNQLIGAEKYWNRALIKVKQLDYSKGIATIMMNIGIVYVDKYDEDSTSTFHYLDDAENEFSKALNIAEEINDSSLILKINNNIGNLFFQKKKYNKALLYYKKAYIIAKNENNSYNEVMSLVNIANIFLNLNQNSKTISTYKDALLIAQENGYKNLIVDIYSNLSSVFEKSKKYKESLKYYTLYDSLSSVIFDENIAKAYAKNEKKYNYEKREKENEKLKITNQLQEEKNTKQRLFLIASIVGLLLLSFLALAILRSYRHKRKANLLLEKQKSQILSKNNELVSLNDEISSQRDEIEAQRDLVSEQKNEIEGIHAEVTHSIEYAERIQTSILPKKEILDSNFSDSFILFKPKDVVSGDFYWFTQVDDIIIATAADCTGHGVPGAFMSMLGVSFLKEIVNKEYITNTGLILNKLRKEVINALQQKGETGEQKDGMDMALISYDKKTKILQFSGANNPLYIVSDEINVLSEYTEYKAFIDENNEIGKNLYEIKPDKMPIAIYLKMDDFITHEIQLKDGDLVYMSSDGYADQFGGPKGKKLKYKPFKRLLLENSNKNGKVQHDQLDNYIENWMAYTDNDANNYEQVDDICVVGLKI